MRLKSRKRITYSLLSVMIILLTFAVCFTVGNFNKEDNIAYADTINGFIHYSGSSHNFQASVYYPSSVSSISEANSFRVNVWTTEIEWSIFGPDFQNVKLTMNRPDGSTKVYPFGNGIQKNHFDIDVFTSADLKDGAGNYIEGAYTVQASGKIVAGATQEQKKSFGFVVNLYAPTVTADAGGKALTYSEVTSKNVTVTASDTNGLSSLKYTYSTDASFSQNYVDFLTGKEFSDEGRYMITAKDVFGRSTSGYFIIDKTAPTLSLSGVSNGGFTNGTVSASWSTTVGGVGSQLVDRTYDSLSVKYAVNTDSSFPTSATKHYSSGTVFSDEGNYLIVITDKAGNSNSYTFTIDKTAPTLSLSGLTNGFTNKKASASWSTTLSGVGGQRTTEDDILTVKYAFNDSDGTFPTSATTNYTSSTDLTEPGNYLIVISDSAGNTTRYTFTIDKTAPTLELVGVVADGFTNGKVSTTWSANIEGVKGQRSNNNDILSVKYSYSASSSFPTSATTPYSTGTNLKVDGNYIITITDKSGNFSTYKFTIDKTAPTLELLGVVSGGFTNSIVSAKWATTVNDITSQRSNSNDILTVKYAYSTGATFPSSATINYTSLTDLSDVGNYLITIFDKAGNFTNYTFTIDKSAPVLTLSGIVSGGFTNKSVSATWETTVEGVKGQRSNNNDNLFVKYAYSTSATFPSAAMTDYTNGTDLSTAGNYILSISDRAGNISSYTFTIDKTAPTLSLSGVEVGGITNNNVTASWSTKIEGIKGQLSNNSDKLNVKYSYLGGLDFPTTATKEYLEGNLSIEGNYLIIITDKAGNSNSYTFTIDKTAPNFVVTAKKYTNEDFQFIADDLHGVAKLEYRLNGENTKEKNGAEITIPALLENCGVWQVRAIDIVGNISTWQEVNMLIRSDFGNLEDARNEYKVAAWYTVTLSAKNFPTETGKYSFETYSAALAFAIQKEWDYRVVSLSNGTWSYSNIANPGVTQIYTKRSELDEAVKKYASANVSARSVLKTSGGAYNTPTDSNGVIRPDALTRQNLIMPDILSAYSNLELLLISHSYTFRMPEEVLPGNTSSLVLSYLSDGITLSDGVPRAFRYGNNIKSLLESENAWKQGYYLVTETDLCGNIEKYIVYLDIDTPAATVIAESGDGTENSFTVDAAFIAGYKDAMLFTGLKFESLIDNMDEFAMLMIDGRNLSEATYIDGDELPYLKYENGYYGKYTITIYDRSFNALSFVVTIAGAAPTIGHSSLTNETRCRITIGVSDNNNAITSVRFFKVSYTGEYSPMAVDDDGTAINSESLEYTLRYGGKYVVIITDVFGREIQSQPLFYMKGLPIGTLSGVKENGVTRNTVTFRYENTNKIIVYLFSGGQWVSGDDRVTIEERSGTNYATIIANPENSYQYKIFLYVADDMNLFVEYIFEIDAIPPSVDITTSEGKIEAETVTRLPFSVGWSEFGITAYYYNKSSTLGELSKARYTKDTMLTQPGMYVFEIADTAGNAISFNVTIDNLVSYFLEGNYSILSDGSYISKNWITLTVTEAVKKWECESSNGITPENGQKITVDGTYKMHIEDLYGNCLDMIVIIDNLPPEPVIKTITGIELNKGAEINQAFNVTCQEDYVIIAYSTDGKTYVTYDGIDIDAEGKHYFKLTDRMGNATIFYIIIDKTVDIKVVGKYIVRENGYLAQHITLIIDEEYRSFKAVSNNGVNVELGKKIIDEGIYTITIEDIAGNIIEINIEIDLTPPEPLIITESGDKVLPNEKTNEGFSVSCQESGAELFIAVGSSYAVYSGDMLTSPGKYMFRTVDIIGNELIFTVEIDGGVDYKIEGKYITDNEGRFVSNTWLIVTVTEEYSAFVVTSDNGRTFSNGEKITYEGVYKISIIDAVGNRITLSLVLDMTPPKALVYTSSGTNFIAEKHNKLNESFTVGCEEELAVLEISRNGQSYTIYDNSTLNAATIYYFRITDLAGNSAVYIVDLDGGVDFTVSGSYKIDAQGRYVSAQWLSITLNEEYETFSVVSDNNNIVYASGDKIRDEGVYHITIIDKANNVVQFDIVIDKTPPEPLITTSTGKSVEPNGKTNEGFTVACKENVGLIYYSTRDSDYSLYDGKAIISEGKHFIKMTDFIGNSLVFTVEIDRIVNYTLKGVYKDITQNVFASNTSITLFINEEYTVFDVETDGGQAVVLGEKIVKEGEYSITIHDAVGNVVKIKLFIDYTAPIITLSGVEPNGVTGKNVKVDIDDFKSATYQEYGSSERITLDSGTIFKMPGQYTIVAEDYAGNRSSVGFTIDGTVAIRISSDISLEQFILGSIEFKFDEKMSSSILTKNGEAIAFNGGKISDIGEYTLTVVDLYDNEVFYKWTILPSAAKAYAFTVGQADSVSVLKDGHVVSGCVIDNKVELTENGLYEITFGNFGKPYTLELIVDAIPPTVEITQEKTNVIINNPSKENVTYELTLNGKPINFSLGNELTATGKYILTVTDEYGNQSIYNFELNYINVYGIIVIVIASILVVAIVLAIIITRRRQGVR